MGFVTSFMRAFNTKGLDPYPVHILRRVDRPTVLIKEDGVTRVDGGQTG